MRYKREKRDTICESRETDGRCTREPEQRQIGLYFLVFKFQKYANHAQPFQKQNEYKQKAVPSPLGTGDP